MEDNKYYTPSIEEFHVGFEYEEQYGGEGKEWVKNIFKETRFWTEMKIGSPPDFKDRIIKKVKGLLLTIEGFPIRVKYLTKEDIESLGWKHIGSGWYESLGYRLRDWTADSLDIYKWYSDDDNQIIFRGDVKNKSELKIIMKQLRIL